MTESHLEVGREEESKALLVLGYDTEKRDAMVMSLVSCRLLVDRDRLDILSLLGCELDQSAKRVGLYIADPLDPNGGSDPVSNWIVIPLETLLGGQPLKARAARCWSFLEETEEDFGEELLFPIDDKLSQRDAALANVRILGDTGVDCCRNLMDPPEDKENENEESAPENSQLGDPFDKEPHLKTPERYVIPGYDTLNAKELPENWVKLLHDSGLTMYFNPITGVATLSRPFIVTPESVKSTTIPIFAIPCLNYRYSKFAPKEPLNSKVSDADKSRVDSDTQQQDSSNCEAKKTLECPIRSVEGGGDCDGANANREDASEVADKEKEEGELTTDEDEEGENEGEDAKHGDLPPPTKRLCRRNVKEKTSPVLESNVTSQNENTAQQEAQPEVGCPYL
ncbi:hypothetical protein EGR_05017 [Echinococcus granulosus]|uniref:Uncharacterized protein n=1 Tax=Echinococcus granulosus TaxID=6210 RepID=W6V2J9_ECHGR|nr:hypothetical protein EGR_05017 [Echinococcus granulosus]EUB60164.1 hypothetical protein EGR_05017 [Echinococcus granulosus]